MKKIRILALVLALLLTASLAACAAKSSAPMAYDNTASAADNYKTEAASEEMPAEAPMMAEPESEWTENSITTQSYAEQSNATNEATDDAPTESLADKMIYSANLEIQTTEYDAAVAALEKAVQDFGGFVSARTPTAISAATTTAPVRSSTAMPTTPSAFRPAVFRSS